MIEGSGSVRLTNGSGSGSRRPKNIRIRRIRIRNTGFNPISDLGFNLAGVAGEEGEEALGAGVDDVDLVEGDGVHHLLPLLQLPLRTLHEPGARACAKHIFPNSNKERT